MAMSTIWYHDFCKIWIKKNWLKIGMMVFLKQKVKVMNFLLILMVRLICELHNVILPEYHSIEAQVVSFLQSI